MPIVPEEGSRRGRLLRPTFSRCAAIVLAWGFSLAPSLVAQTYDVAASFEQGWVAKSNPNGVWSYGYSSGFASPVTLYNQTVQNGVNGPNAQYWWSPSIAISDSPSAEFNDGPAYNDGNVNFLANEFVLVSGIGGQYSDLIFTAPAAGTYSIVSSFRGAQYCIGTVVGVVENGTVAFSSKVTAEGQLVPFNGVVSLNAGNTVVFSVGPGGGCQNTGLSATITPTQTFSLPLQITTTVLPNAKSGQAYITALGAAAGSGTGYTWCIQTGSGCVQSGSPLPTGFTLGSGGVLSSTGAPAAPANSYAFTVQVTDSAGNVATQALTVVVQPPLPPLQITNTTLPNATSGQPYSTTLTAAGGSGAGYTWTLSSGFLPAGFTLSSTGGLISTGIPAASANLYVVTAQVTDSAGNLAQKAFTLLTTSPVAQACVAPPQGILAWWPFDETAGPTAADLVGGRTGTYFGTPPPLPAPGQVNNALSFGGSGAGDFVGVASDPVWGFGYNDFSIEFWANFSAAPGGSPGEPGAIFIGVDQGPGVVNKWFFATGGALEFVSYNAAVPGPIFLEFAPFAPTVGQWYHLALTKSGSLFTAYVNGNPAGSVTATVDVPGPSAFLTIGEAENIGFMNGLLDEVTIYNRALTGAEVASIFAAGSAGKCRGTTGPQLQIESVNPAVGGNAGQVTVSITGAGFEPAATVNLVSGSQVIVQGTNTTLVSPTVLQTTFDLTTVAAQNVQVQVNNPDPATAMFPFSVISGGAPQVNLQLVGPATARVGRTAPIAAILTNLGSVNANYVTVSASYSCPQSGPSTLVTPMPLMTGQPVFEVPLSPIQVPLQSLSSLLILGLPTGVSVPVQIPIVPPPGSSCTVNVQTNWPPPPPPPPNPPSGSPNPPDCTDSAQKEYLLQKAKELLIGLSEQYALDVVQYNCDQSHPDSQCVQLTEAINSVFEALDLVNTLLDALLEDCPVPPTNVPYIPLPNQQDQNQTFSIVSSWDPNAKSGPAGSGLANAVTGYLLPYTIFFQNDASATAPAQQIFVVDPLDPALDVSTASLGTLVLGSLTVDIGPGQHATRTIDLRPSTNALLQVQADVDIGTRQITWVLSALDPTTLQLPSDPQVGILPPDQNPPQGEGYLTFTVSAKKGTPQNTTISNQATVTFDVNPPIQTNVWSNTTGAAPVPPSQVATTASGLAYSRVSQTFNGTVTIKNISSNAISGPFQIVFESLPTGVTLANGSGTYYGNPYITVNVTNLAVGQAATVSVDFKNPSNATINSTPVIYSGSIN